MKKTKQNKNNNFKINIINFNIFIQQITVVTAEDSSENPICIFTVHYIFFYLFHKKRVKKLLSVCKILILYG